jgi:hypothetical protein
MKLSIAKTSHAVVVCALLASGVPSKAGGVQDGDTGREPVTLILTAKTDDGCGQAKLGFVRAMPDGSAASTGFRIPDGHDLVATDIDWLYAGGTPGATQVLLIAIENLADSSKRHLAFESSARLGFDGTGGANEHLVSGFLVSSAARMCVDVTPGPIGPPYRLSSVVVRGYLMASR